MFALFSLQGPKITPSPLKLLVLPNRLSAIGQGSVMNISIMLTADKRTATICVTIATPAQKTHLPRSPQPCYQIIVCFHTKE